MTSDATPAEVDEVLVRRHLAAGWALLLLFLTLGIALEAMHGFKLGWYLDTDQQTRRELMTLAHAHGVLLALVQVAFAATVHLLPGLDPRGCRMASPCLLTAALLMPLGFLLGGLFPYGGDPGLGVFLVPPAALLLFAGVALTARAIWRRS